MKALRATASRWRGAAFLVVLACIAGAGVWIFLRSQPPSPLRLAAVPFGSLPGWAAGDDGAALAAFRRSCSVLAELPPARRMGGAGYAGDGRDWQQVCAAANSPVASKDARRWFERSFTPFAVSAGTDDEALLTGYYEPEIRGSRTAHGIYASPVYGAPQDLVVADLGLFRSNLAGIRISGRLQDQRLVPFPTRAAIDERGLSDAPVLLYANDPIAVFFLHIQGSGRAHLDDGSTFRLAYAGQNGRAYTPIGRTLIAHGEIDRAHMSMQTIRAWLQMHPGAARQTMETDESYVFFRELPVGDPRLGSPGSEGVPLTAEASIAVDPHVHPLGIPIFVATEISAADPAHPPIRFTRLCIAQDTGGAIKGDLRADVFWGFGPRAEAIAGRMKAAGRLYILLPKSVAARMGARFPGIS